MAFPDGYVLNESGYFKVSDASGPYAINSAGVPTLMSGAGGGGGGGASTISDGADVALGARADEAATTDAGTFSLIALFKRLLGKQPALGAAASAASVPVVLATNDAQIGTKVTASTALATGGTGLIGWLSTIRDALLGLLTVNTLAQPAVACQLAAAASGGTSANTALTTTCRRISITARLSDIRYAIGSAAQTASATTHFIAMGERLDLAVPATPNIAVLSATTTAGVLEVTELT